MARWTYKLGLRLRSLLGRKSVERELGEEVRFHLEKLAEENRAKGMSAEEARHAAMRQFGGVEQVKEECRDTRGLHLVETTLQDIRYGLRQLRRNPGFTIVAILTLALGIGANTAIFSVYDSFLLAAPPIPHPQQVVTLADRFSTVFSYPDFREIRRQSEPVFSGVAADSPLQMTGMYFNGVSRSVLTGYVSWNFFRVLEARPVLGSVALPESASAPSEQPVVVLGYELWKSQFGGNPSVIGKSVLVDGHPFTIIGVAPKELYAALAPVAIEAYLPLGTARVTGGFNYGTTNGFATDPGDKVLSLVARLKPGVSLASAQAALGVIAHRVTERYPAADKGLSLRAYPLRRYALSADSPGDLGALWALAIFFQLLAGVVLVLACVNVANLLLARSIERKREIALRSALGAAPGRLVHQLLTESLLLALLGCACGVAVGLGGSRVLAAVVHSAPAGPLVLAMNFGLDWRVLACAIGIALLTGLLVGTLPALRAARLNLTEVLHEGGRSASKSHHRLRDALVAAQVAGSLVLLIVAGMLVRSLANLEGVRLGFQPENVLNFTMEPSEAGYNHAQGERFLRSLLPRVRALPGVQAASLSHRVPMSIIGSSRAQLNISGGQSPGNGAPSIGYNTVSSDYFRTMGIPILRGRPITDADTQGSPRVIVINESMAQKYWPGENPVGRVVEDVSQPGHPIEVVGVAGNVRNDRSGPIFPFVYFPILQHYPGLFTLQVRTPLPLSVMAPEVESAVEKLEPRMPVLGVQTMEDALDSLKGFFFVRFGAGLAGTLGLLGLVLAVIGVYGVVSFAANQRTHEIGLRLALGAPPIQVLGTILRQAFLIVGVGVAVGLFAAAAISVLLSAILGGAPPLDPSTYAAASALLLLVALAACYIPARRAMRVDPVVALRHE